MFEVDPASGNIQGCVRSDHEIAGFQAAGANVVTLDGQTGTLRALPLETLEEQDRRTAAGFLAEIPGAAPVIEVKDGMVIIGGVAVPRKT